MSAISNFLIHPYQKGCLENELKWKIIIIFLNINYTYIIIHLFHFDYNLVECLLTYLCVFADIQDKSYHISKEG